MKDNVITLLLVAVLLSLLADLVPARARLLCLVLASVVALVGLVVHLGLLGVLSR